MSINQHNQRASEMERIQQCARALAQGHLVAFPTETVYGLGGDAGNEDAVLRIFETKGRPATHPLIVHLSELRNAERWCLQLPDYAWELAHHFWPGAITLIVPKAKNVSELVTGGQDTVGLRVPSHPVAQELLRAFVGQGGSGIAAPSANRFGRVSPTTADAVRSELGPYFQSGDQILDGGLCQIGVESTIIDCTGKRPAVARPGAITHQMIREVTGLDPVVFSGQIRVSGTLTRHYSPRARVVLDVDPQPGDGLIALASEDTPEGVIRLLSAEDIEHYARDLYGALRRADQMGLSRIVAWSPEGHDLAVAIRDRLSRASAAS